MFNSARSAIAALIVAALSGAAAHAETISADFAGVGPGETVSVTLDGVPFKNISAGYFNWTNVNPNTTFLGSAFQSFCVELNVGVAASTTFTFTPLQPRYTDTQTSRLREYFGENFANAGSNATTAAAFQLGLWEIVHENSGSLNLSTGNYTADSSPNNNAAINLAQSWLNALDGQGTFEDNLIVLDSAGSQDQIVRTPMVPVPPSVILGGMGLISLVGYGIRRRRLAKNSPESQATA
jgi:hypothetical protein